MGRIFISAAHGGLENGVVDPGSVVAGTTEAREMILTRDLIVAEVRSRGFEVLSVPDALSSRQTIDWINSRTLLGDVALEISTNTFANPTVRGASVLYIVSNDQRKAHAELLLLSLLRRLPPLPNRGARPDSTSGLGSLAFCRQVVAPSLVMEIGFLSNPNDRALLQSRRPEVAVGIAEGLVAWSRDVSPPPVPAPYPSINININGKLYGEQGILVNGNAYIPIDLVDRLGVNLAKVPEVRRLAYNHVVYVKAIELRDFQVAVTWDNANRAVVLRSPRVTGQIDLISKPGTASEAELMQFVAAQNPTALSNYPTIARDYIEESKAEKFINHDIAFCQMCLETDFLRFPGPIKSPQNNFAGLGAVGGSSASASFDRQLIGVRAHIQHLKAYANTEPLLLDVVDPRFRFITRGIAPLISLLSGRWSADSQYGDKVMALLTRLYGG
jgi:N-acetylmuramoyl-L-alanine amidase/Mannosyl-glycoprotein endo-beta-N-acetylglucosaminidase